MTRNSPPSDEKARLRLVRAAATKVRAGGAPPRSQKLAHLAEQHLHNRAQYNARRKKVRDLAAQVRRGEKPSAEADLLDAAHRWLAYRKQYNADRVAARQAAKKRR